MGARYFQPSHYGVAPEILHFEPEASATIGLGEVVARDGTNDHQIEPHAGSTTVDGIVGIALGKATSGVPTYGDKIPVAIARRDVLFLGQVYDVSASAVATASVATHEGDQFGIVKVNGVWYVDEEDTTNVVLQVVRVLPEINCVLFRFITDAIESAT